MNAKDEEALCRLIRLLIVLCHNGLLRARYVIVDASRRLLKNSVAKPRRWLSLYLSLYKWIDRELAMLAMRNLSMDADGIASYVTARFELGDFLSPRTLQNYDFFVKSISAGFVDAMTELGLHFLAVSPQMPSLGLERVCLELFLCATNRGDCEAFFNLLMLSQDRQIPAGFGSTLIRFVQRARDLYFGERDIRALNLLELVYRGGCGFVQDLVLVARLRRHPGLRGALQHLPPLVLLGERLWLGGSNVLLPMSDLIMLFNYRDHSERFDLTLGDFGLA